MFLLALLISYGEPKIDVDALKVGDKGIIVYPSNVARVGKEPVEVRVVRVLDEKSLYVNTYGKYYFVLERNSKGIVDEAILILDRPLHVKETRRVGTRTVFVLSPLEKKK